MGAKTEIPDKKSRNQTWRNFGGGPREALNPLSVGSLWMGSIAIYSSGTTFLGILGVSIGWALFQIVTILTGNVAGLLTGEWRQREPRISRANLMGVAVLFQCVILIGAANYQFDKRRSGPETPYGRVKR